MTEISSLPTTRRNARALEGHRRARGGGGTRRAALAVVPLALLGSGALVYGASNAAFTASTSTGSNSFTAGNVNLANGTTGSSTISVSNLKPGSGAALSKCIKVDYSGNLAANVRMYVSSFVDTARPGTGAGSISGMGAGTEILGNYLRASVEEGTGSAADCSDFAATPVTPVYLTSGGAAGAAGGELLKTFRNTYNAFPSLPASYDGNATTWSPSGAASRTYKLTYWLPDLGETGAPSGGSAQSQLNDLQGAALSATLTWEARNS